MAYRYQNLTSAIADRSSPLRQYLDAEFPHVAPVQRAYRESSGPLLVDGTPGVDPATLGAAFDLRLRFVLAPDQVPVQAMQAFQRSAAAVEVIGEVADAAAAARSGDEELLSRATWALALCVEVYRSGLRRGSVLERVIAGGRFTPEVLLELAPPGALRQQARLGEVAGQELLRQLSGRVAVGPTFAGAAYCPADADLLICDLLPEIKTRLGVPDRRSGQRHDRLSAADLYQLLGYALFDHSDAYAIRRLGLYSARYGHLAEWGLGALANELAGRPVDLAAERARVWEMLGSPQGGASEPRGRGA